MLVISLLCGHLNLVNLRTIINYQIWNTSTLGEESIEHLFSGAADVVLRDLVIFMNLHYFSYTEITVIEF